MKERLRGQNINYEVPYPQHDNSANWYHVRLFPITRGDNDIYGLMFAVSNITEKKLLENELISRKVQDQKNIVRAILKAQEIERNKLSQELHDNVNQILATVRMYLDTAQRQPHLQKTLIPQAKKHIDLAISEIRMLCRKQVMPQKGVNLKKLIDELLLDMSVQTDTGFHSQVAADLSIDEDLKLNIYRIVQEQIVNICKHANASEANIVIYQAGDSIFMRITDNGKGFDPLVRRKGIGITNMINRVESYNGEVLIDSHPGKGCRLEVRMPAAPPVPG